MAVIFRYDDIDISVCQPLNPEARMIHTATTAAGSTNPAAHEQEAEKANSLCQHIEIIELKIP
jgi:hypothetical protein